MNKLPWIGVSSFELGVQNWVIKNISESNEMSLDIFIDFQNIFVIVLINFFIREFWLAIHNQCLAPLQNCIERNALDSMQIIYKTASCVHPRAHGIKLKKWYFLIPFIFWLITIIWKSVENNSPSSIVRVVVYSTPHPPPWANTCLVMIWE